MGLRRRIEGLEEEDYRSVWPLEEQIIACIDIVKRRSWERVWPPGATPIRYQVDRDLPGPVSSPYPATDREIRLLGAMCRYQKERKAGEHEGGQENAVEYVREYLDEDKSIEECIADFTDYVGKLVRRMEPGKQSRREEQLYRLWQELAEE